MERNEGSEEIQNVDGISNCPECGKPLMYPRDRLAPNYEFKCAICGKYESKEL